MRITSHSLRRFYQTFKLCLLRLFEKEWPFPNSDSFVRNSNSFLKLISEESFKMSWSKAVIQNLSSKMQNWFNTGKSFYHTPCFSSLSCFYIESPSVSTTAWLNLLLFQKYCCNAQTMLRIASTTLVFSIPSYATAKSVSCLNMGTKKCLTVDVQMANYSYLLLCRWRWIRILMIFQWKCYR